MNIYDYFQEPSDLDGFSQREYLVPRLAYTSVYSTEVRMPEYEAALAKVAQYSFHYAKCIGERFVLGEPAIMNAPDHTCVWLHYNHPVAQLRNSTLIQVTEAYCNLFGIEYYYDEPV